MDTTYSSILAHTPEQHLDNTGSSQGKIFPFESYETMGKTETRASSAAFVLKKNTNPRSLLVAQMSEDWVRLSVRISTEKFTSASPNLGQHYDSAIIIMKGKQDITVFNSPNHGFLSIGMRREMIDELLTPRPELSADNVGTIIYRVNPLFRKALIENINSLLAMPGTEDELNRQVRNCILLALDDAAETEQTYTTDNRTRITSMAIGSIIKSGGKKVSMQSLAESCHCSIRTLEYAFKDKLELSPKEFLTYFRLNCYREEIIKNPSATLSDLARDLEFRHLGNLAKNYRNLFGSLPSSLEPE